MEAGRGQLEQVPLQLNEVLSEVVELSGQGRKPKGDPEFAGPADLPQVLADRRGLEEVFTNLVSNAINYSPDGGQVTVSALSHGDYLD